MPRFFEKIRRSDVNAKLDHHAAQLSALGHPVRLRLLRWVVQAGPDGAAAGELQARLDIPASTLSHHLKRLVDADLLHMRAQGTYNYYVVDYEALRELTGYLWEDCCRRGATKCC